MFSESDYYIYLSVDWLTILPMPKILQKYWKSFIDLTKKTHASL